MPTAELSRATTSAAPAVTVADDPKDRRLFIVRKSMSGFPDVGHIFSERQFIDLHPTKGLTPEHQSRIDGQIDAATYHDDLINYHLEIGTFEAAPPGSAIMEVPLTPRSQYGGLRVKNANIRAAAAEYRERLAKRASIAQNDLANYRQSQQEGAGEVVASEPVVRRPAGSR